MEQNIQMQLDEQLSAQLQPTNARQTREEWLSEYEQTRRELEASFSRNKYNVVRKELFAHRNDAACTIRPDSISFNQSCINGLEGVVYIRMSINEELHRILVEPCGEDTPHALRWCVASGSKRKTRQMSGRDFSTLIYNMMSWRSDIRYKVLGFRIEIEKGVYAYLFKLDSPEKFDILPATPKKKKKRADGASEEKGQNEEAEAPVKRQTPKGYYDEDVLTSYGIPYDQYKRETAVTEKDGFIQLGMLTGGQEGTYGD